MHRQTALTEAKLISTSLSGFWHFKSWIEVGWSLILVAAGVVHAIS
jgi:hypothetical protein